MKTLLITLTLIFSSVGWSKVDNFGEMIHQNKIEQKQLHQQIKATQGWKKEVIAAAPRNVVLETTVGDYTPKTRQSLLSYRKENTDNRPIYKKQMGRVAQELTASQGEF